MKEWGYDEIFQEINEDYNDYLKLNRGHEYAIARTINEYINLGKVEDFIVDTAVGEILLSKDKVFIGYVKGISKRLRIFKDLDVTKELTQEEIADLTNRIEKVLDGLSKIEIDYSFYSE
ncbi:Imm3 family immunity protein [Bacillus cereus group sp. BfR-BA-01383]|uniref:Imm3 family immunity protein n=1 Tax=Bacillus cereus group sp. BfR-BA-01383 TaxID=2920327 RepID=UPI001F56AF47|nr:Imm3 family immunity protein [Bacillus cereus group sp. BfR-BA-01383]